MATIRCVKIHLMPGARDRAARAIMEEMRKNGERVPNGFGLEFTGPDFHDVERVDAYPDQVRVILKDSTIYTYPMHQVARVKEYNREVVA